MVDSILRVHGGLREEPRAFLVQLLGSSDFPGEQSFLVKLCRDRNIRVCLPLFSLLHLY